MNSGSINCCFPNVSHSLQSYSMTEDHQHHHNHRHNHNQLVASSSLQATPNPTSASAQTHSSNSLLYNLSILKEKVHQVESLVSILLSPNQNQLESTSLAIASMTQVIQEIIMTSSSMMFTFQQMGNLGSIISGNNPNTISNNNVISVGNLVQERGNQALYATTTSDQTLDWFGESYNNNMSNIRVDERKVNTIPLGSTETKDGFRGFSSKHCNIIELDASDLLAKYTHYCQVCGKGFKRDANLRMHMRAHGDEYKTNAALSNPFKNSSTSTSTIMGNKESSILKSLPRKYSCPQEGCRWNQRHAKFQPLKSMICVKNHYKRSHCPKIYVCKRCNRKQFSVLSDLRTHEKHCGDLKWQCSCGTTFSRKDKLMGHVALFTGHIPIVTSSTKHGKNDEHQASQLQ